MQATRPPDERRARHEATGEWPQPSLSAMLAERVRRTPERVYLIEGRREGGRSYTFGDLAARAERIAGALLALGVRPGDVVSWQLPNWFEGAALAVAIDRLGAVSNPIITIYREREMTFVCRQAGARVLVVPGVVRGVDHRELARAVRAAAPDLEHVLTVRAEPGPGMRALEALEATPAEPLPPTRHGPHDVSMLFYTSGTTADPKGVLHTPSTLGAVIRFQAELLHPSPDDRSLLQFPLPHLGGVVMFVILPVAHGSSTVFMETFDPELAVDLIERHRITSAGGPPAVLQAMFAARNFSPEKVRSVRGSGAGRRLHAGRGPPRRRPPRRGRRGLHPDRRPPPGHHHPQGREPLRQGHRGRSRRAPEGGRRGGDRGARRRERRAGVCVRGAAAGRDEPDPRRGARLHGGAGGDAAEDPGAARGGGRAAAQRDGEGPEGRAASAVSGVVGGRAYSPSWMPYSRAAFSKTIFRHSAAGTSFIISATTLLDCGQSQPWCG